MTDKRNPFIIKNLLKLNSFADDLIHSALEDKDRKIVEGRIFVLVDNSSSLEIFEKEIDKFVCGLKSINENTESFCSIWSVNGVEHASRLSSFSSVAESLIGEEGFGEELKSLAMVTKMEIDSIFILTDLDHLPETEVILKNFRSRRQYKLGEFKQEIYLVNFESGQASVYRYNKYRKSSEIFIPNLIRKQ
jgi:hypothetical protein